MTEFWLHEDPSVYGRIRVHTIASGYNTQWTTKLEDVVFCKVNN